MSRDKGTPVVGCSLNQGAGLCVALVVSGV
jgi:hypothetical protein